MPLNYILLRIWQWIIDPGLMLGLLVVLAFMVPRVGRFAFRVINRRISHSTEEGDSSADEGKAQLALTSVAVYLGQLVAYFLIFVFALQQLGFSLAGATVPATVASAAIGLGAQSIIADFLAGFFILTEKQYGIGDWVRFEGNGIKVEGTVIQITMRATRIRTLAEETITIPNSTAKVCINSSNYWSRAVVTISVPLLGSSSAHEAIERSTAAAQRAIDHPQVAGEVLDELNVQPAVGITPPTTVGMPWMIEMRFLAKVTAGSQWMVERAIRTEVLDEFWDEYGSASTVTGELRNTLEEVDGPSPSGTSLDDAPTTHLPRVDRTPAAPPADAAPSPADRVTDYGSDPQLDTAEQAREKAAAAPGDEDAPTTRLIASGDESAPEAEPAEDEQATGAAPSRWRRLLSLGGRVRVSTTVLAVATAALVFLWASTLQTGDNWEGSNGWLAPTPPEPAATAPAVEQPQPQVTQPPAEETPTSETPTGQETAPSTAPSGVATSDTEPTPAQTPGETEPSDSAPPSQVPATPSTTPGVANRGRTTTDGTGGAGGAGGGAEPTS